MLLRVTQCQASISNYYSNFNFTPLIIKHHHSTIPATPAPWEVNLVITKITSQSRASLIFFCLNSCTWNYRTRSTQKNYLQNQEETCHFRVYMGCQVHVSKTIFLYKTPASHPLEPSYHQSPHSLKELSSSHL